MRRRHNVIASTIFIIGILFLCARREADLRDYNLWNSGNDGEEESGAYVHAGSRLKLGQGTHSVTTSLPSQTTLASFVDKNRPELADQLLSPLPSQQNAEGQGKGPAAEPVQDTVALPPASNQDAPTVFQPEFQFQNELDLELPVSVFKSYSNHVPLHHGPEKTYAYATFMATRNPSLKDPYFLAIHSLIYRVLWSARSRTEKYPFIVFVAEYVTTEQRQLLSGAGAIVRELKPVPWQCDKEGVQKRWTDLFAKLNMWAEVDYQRILFLDADAFPQANIDVMFEVPSMQHCIQSKLDLDDLVPGHTAVCEPYIFAGVPQDTNPAAPNINVGSMVFTPSLHMHQRLMQNYLKYDKYDCAMAEQAFLNWQFSPEGAYPSMSLERKWGGHFPKEEEEGQLNVVHEKIWAFGDGWTKKDWVNTWIEMSQFYTSEEFAKQRGALGTL